MTDLLFRRSLTHHTGLVLGEDGPPAGFVAHVSIGASFPAISAQVQVAVAYGVQITAILPIPTASVAAQYRSETSRPVVGTAADAIQVATRAQGVAVERVQLGETVAARADARWQEAEQLCQAVAVAWSESMRARSACAVLFQRAIPTERAVGSAFQDAVHRRIEIRSQFEQAQPTASSTRSAFQDAYRDRRLAMHSGFADGRRALASISRRSRPAASHRSGSDSRFQNARKPLAGIWIAPTVPIPGRYVPPSGDSVHLLFREPLRHHVNLVFGRLGEPATGQVTIPIRSTYIVINDVSLLRLPEQILLQAYDLSLAWDTDRWSVNWSATLPSASLDAIMPDSVGAPVDLQATVNGTSIRLLAESIGRDRRFGDTRLKVSGRGRVAWLANPYAVTVSRTNDTLLTSQQLADAALAINGVPIGWALDWQIADWNVPVGVWSHTGSHIEAVQRIAEAAGGYVLGHRSNQTLHVRKRYPLLPWEWAAATPDVVIPAAVASTESIAWTEKPSYNRVFVSGEAGGILGDVKRVGTAGDLAAQMVTDSLITAEAAARARGGTILADTGRQASISIQMPVLEETGILDLGQLVEYNDGTHAYRGLVRSVSIRAALPQVWQTVEIETHA